MKEDGGKKDIEDWSQTHVHANAKCTKWRSLNSSGQVNFVFMELKITATISLFRKQTDELECAKKKCQ